jgi:hypothetical protein
MTAIAARVHRFRDRNSAMELALSTATWLTASRWVPTCPLYLSPFTARAHVQRAMTKLSARDRAQLAVIAGDGSAIGIFMKS